MVWFLELYSCLFFRQHVCISGLMGLQRWPRLIILCFNINNTNFHSIILITGPSSALQWGPQCGLENVSVTLHGIRNWPQPLTIAEVLLSTYCLPDGSDGWTLAFAFSFSFCLEVKQLSWENKDRSLKLRPVRQQATRNLITSPGQLSREAAPAWAGPLPDFLLCEKNKSLFGWPDIAWFLQMLLPIAEWRYSQAKHKEENTATNL